MFANSELSSESMCLTRKDSSQHYTNHSALCKSLLNNFPQARTMSYLEKGYFLNRKGVSK